MRAIWRRLLIIPPILLGIVALVLSVAARQSPRQEDIAEEPRPLLVTTVQQRSVQPRVVGYGLAQPSQVWRAVARVAGTVVETHQELKSGSIVTAGSTLVRIDPTDYELQIAQLTANASALQAQIAETQATRKNDEATLALEQESYALFEKELKRQRQLRERNATSVSATEYAERELLRQQRSVQTLRNAISLVPAKLDRLQADLLAVQKQLAAAQRDLERTVIVAPFDCRLVNVTIENGQYVATNEQLFEVHGVETMEVEARLPIDDLVKLVPTVVSPGTAETEALEDIVRGMDASVRVRSGDYVRALEATLVRIRETVDRRTRTVGVVVEITGGASTGELKHPPFLEGTFCEVEFAGKPRFNQLVIPAAAVRDGKVYVVENRPGGDDGSTTDMRLRHRTVAVLLTIRDEVVVQGDLKEGELIVIGDPTPAVEGMLVEPIKMEPTSNRVPESQGSTKV